MQCDQCISCRHYQGCWSCDAFPEMDSIPVEIATGGFDHSRPFPGDKGIRWSPLLVPRMEDDDDRRSP